MKKHIIIIGFAILITGAFAAPSLSPLIRKTTAQTETQQLIDEHMELYEKRGQNDQASVRYLESEEYNRVMDTLDDYDSNDQKFTELMLGIQAALRVDCVYWNSEAQKFRQEEDCHDNVF